MSKKEPNFGFMATLFVVIMIVSGLTLGALRGNIVQLAPISTYQGVHPSFEAIYHEGEYYTTSQPGEATTCRVGPATLHFDPDLAKYYTPNLVGELRDVQIVRDLSQYEPGDVYTHLINAFDADPQPDKPYKVYEWEVPEGDDKHIYRMELWICSLQVNLWITADARPWHQWVDPGERMDQRYVGTETWLKLEASNEWGHYFTGPDLENVYFGLAYMELAEFSGTGDDTRLAVLPMSKWSALDVYDQIGGGGATPRKPMEEVYGWEGAVLSERVFRKEWYTKLSLVDFGTYDHNILDGSYKADGGQWKILVHLFVVGDWIVKPEQEREMEEPEPPYKRGWMNEFLNWVDNPLNRIKFMVLTTILIIVILFFVFPQTLLMLFNRYQKSRSILGRRSKG